MKKLKIIGVVALSLIIITTSGCLFSKERHGQFIERIIIKEGEEHTIEGTGYVLVLLSASEPTFSHHAKAAIKVYYNNASAERILRLAPFGEKNTLIFEDIKIVLEEVTKNTAEFTIYNV